jgi:hypothetical protein
MEYPPLGASFLRVSRVAVQIERNQVVFLIVRRCLVHVAGRAELLLLDCSCSWPVVGLSWSTNSGCRWCR